MATDFIYELSPEAEAAVRKAEQGGRDARPPVQGGQGRQGEQVVCAALVVSACLAIGGTLIAALLTVKFWLWIFN